MLPYGSMLKDQRKLCHIALSPDATKKYRGVQEDAAVMFLQSLVDAPDNFMKELRLSVCSLLDADFGDLSV